MEKYRSIDANWEQDEHLYIDDCGELQEYLFNGRKHYAIVSNKIDDYFYSNSSSNIAQRIVDATRTDFDTGMYQFNYMNDMYFWIYNSTLGAHNKPESLFVAPLSHYSINFNKKLQKLSQISGTMENGRRSKAFNLQYHHSNESWAFNLHVDGTIKISSKPNTTYMTLDQKSDLPQWFKKCKKEYSDYVQIVEDVFAKIPLDR